MKNLREGINQLQRIKGFTLIELILVTLVLSVIVGLIVPNFSKTYLQFELKQTANDLSYLMRYAQSRAVIKNHQLQLEFDEEGAKYFLTEKSLGNDEDPSDGTFERLSGRMGRTFSVPRDIQIKKPESILNFYSDGSIDPQKISVCCGERCLIVSTQEQRGYVQVFEERVE